MKPERAAGALVCGILWLAGCGKSAPVPRPKPSVVGVVRVIQMDVPIYGEWVATLDGYVNASVQPQVTGYLIRQYYREGSFVRKGQILFAIDPRPFQAEFDRALGQLAEARGQLEQARAQVELARINVKRDTPLAAAHAIPQSQLDNDIQALKQAEALARSGEAAVQAAQAAVASARLNLGFTNVRSLVDGIAGIATTQVGNLVGPSIVLTSVSQVNPIKAYFPISEQEYLKLAKHLGSGAARGLLAKNAAVPLELTLADGSVYPHRGRVLFADREVDPQTGTIRLVGAFPNPGNLLRPGQFGRVRAITTVRKGALLVPQRAITQLQTQYQVASVGPGNRVQIRNVEPGERYRQMWIVNSGLQPGELVISEGTSKVQAGQTVQPVPDTSLAGSR